MSTKDERIARWLERRKTEQAARERHQDLPSSLALVAARAETLAQDENDEVGGLLDLVLESLRDEPHRTLEDRRRVYDSVARGVERGVAESGLNSEFAELRRRQLRAIIRSIEADIRHNIDFAAAGYRPTDIDRAVQPLIDGYRRHRRRLKDAEAGLGRRAAVAAGEAFAIAVSPEEEADLAYITDVLARSDAVCAAAPGANDHATIRSWATLLRYQLTLLRSESRIALLWMMIGPAVLIGLISLGYFLIGTQWVLNMDVPTFAVTGATTWLMFRNVIFRSTAAFHAHTWILNMRPFRPWMVAVSTGVWIMVAYAFVFCVLIGTGHLIGVFTLPDDPAGVAFWFVSVGCFGLAFGVVFGAIAVVWPYSPRLAPAIERFLEVFSSVILVSEQLPRSYRWLALWSPLAHALQLLRASYFHSYDSVDADPTYFFICLALMVIAAIISQRLVRSRSLPI